MLHQETRRILESLLNKRRIGGKHTEEKNCLRKIKNLSPEEKSIVLKEWKWCINQELILRLPKTGEWHVSLNPRKLKEVYEIIK